MLSIFYSEKNDKYTTLANLLFLFSCVCMTILFSKYGGIYTLISVTISFGISVYLFLIRKIQNELFLNLNKKIFIVSIILSCFAEISFGKVFYDNYATLVSKAIVKFNLANILNWQVVSIICTVLLCIFSFIIISFCFYIAYTKIVDISVKLYKSFTNVEKISFLVMVALFTIYIIVSYCYTYVFWGTQKFDGIPFDIIYTSDSGTLFSSNCWLNVLANENDLRQPLFGVFAAPFTVVPYAISLIFFFVPNIYAFLVAIEQVILLVLTIFLLVKMIDVNDNVRLFLYYVFACSFPILLFSLNLEQYIFATFYLILFIYSTKVKLVNNEQLFITSTGSLMTSGILFPLLYKKEEKLKRNIVNLLKLLLVFIIMCFIFGRGVYLVDIVDYIKGLFAWSGEDISIIGRLQQYFVFVSSCFIYPTSVIVNKSIQLETVSGFNIVGIILFSIAILSFIINRKKFLAKISFAWICFSFVMLGIIGWGAKENGMVLYTLYFGWAFIVLIVMFVNIIPQKLFILKNILFTCSIVTLLYYNIPGMIKIINFGIMYYPMV